MRGSHLARVEAAERALGPPAVTTAYLYAKGDGPPVRRILGPQTAYALRLSPAASAAVPAGCFAVLKSERPPSEELPERFRGRIPTEAEGAAILAGLVELLEPDQARVVSGARNVVLFG